MEYASVKDNLRKIIGSKPFLRKMFYLALEKLFLRERYVKRELKRLLPRLNPGAIILDAGFGYGQYAYYIARNYAEAKITAVDIEPVMLDDFGCFLAKIHCPNISLELTDLTSMNHKGRFDMALSVDVMEHIEDDVSVFHNIHRALKEGGVFLMHTPHLNASSERGQGSFVGEHIRDGYSTEELVNKLKEAGFKGVNYTLTYGKHGAKAWRLLQKYPITVLKSSKLFFLLLPFYYALIYPVACVLMRRDMKSRNLQGDGILIEAWK